MHSPSPRIIVGVSCAIFNRNSQILLIKRRNPPFQGKWSRPGGKLNFGESVFQCGKREVFEETGLEVDILQVNDIIDAILPEQDTQFVVINLLAKISNINNDQIQANDDAEYAQWTSFDQFPSDSECTDQLRKISVNAWNKLSSQ